MCLSGNAAAQFDPVSETAIKAAFLSKFPGYVEWPVEDDVRVLAPPLVIGVLGARELLENLQQIVAGQDYAGRSMLVREVERGAGLDDVQVLFVGISARDMLAQIGADNAGRPLLVVTEVPGELPPGAVINFVVADNRVTFDVSLATARRNGLHISARLLAVARRVLEM